MGRRPEASVLSLLLLSFIALAGAPGQVVRERVSVQAVAVTVTARDNAGRPVHDLRATELALSVDGKPVVIDTLAREPRATASVSADLPAPATPAQRETAARAPSVSPARPLEIAIIVDEESAYLFDRRDVYDELARFLSVPAPGGRRFLVARFASMSLMVECPWTSDAEAAREAISRLRSHPRLPGQRTSSFDIEMTRNRFVSAILELFAAFSDGSSRRQLLLVSDGVLLARPEDLLEVIANSQRSSLEPFRQRGELFGNPEAERGRQTFQLWSRAVSNRVQDALTTTDLIAKALEQDIVLIPISAVAIDRDVNPGADTKSLGHSTPAGGVLSAHIGLVQGMMRVAEDTGGEPILLPKKTASRLAEIEDRDSWALTFLDPAAGDHQYHRIEIVCRRPGVRLDYRRGYRIATQEERMLDGVVAGFLQPGRGANPLEMTASLSPALSKDGRGVTRLSLHYVPPRESNQTNERNLDLVAVGQTPQGDRTEPIRWSGEANRLEAAAGIYEAILDLKVPAGSHAWSLAVRDQPTGLVSYVLTSTAR